MNSCQVERMTYGIQFNKRKEKELRSLKAMAAGIIHEVGNPLSVLKGYAEWLGSDLGEFRSQLLLHEIRQIEQTLHKLELLAHMDRESTNEYQAADVNHVLHMAVKEMKETFMRQQIHIHKNMTAGSQQLDCQSEHLRQLFLFILQNAVDAMPNGGFIGIEVHRIGDVGIEIIISDTGRGISPERMKFIGEPYFSTREKGVGLGLAVCQSIVYKHQGTMILRSTLGMGTTVHIYFPFKHNA